MQNCPKCGRFNDYDTCLTTENKTPAPGDYSICANCFAILQFSGSLVLIVCTDPPAEFIAYSKALRRFRSIYNFN